ncbi:unnamed protein product [Cuscuta europaea]|uniref:Transposase-associated domain-containing protein n=1 Tax=Cuscuta europaea TaxID=41803 RepID=A0A9P0YGX6_CUSEU|nr:unnamed protein product [Cuscuta europaea]
MDRSWMYGLRNTSEFFTGVNGFIKHALAHQKQGHIWILCPCSRCRNLKKENDANVVLQHLLQRGFRENYRIWSLHGETCVDDEVVARPTSSNLKRKVSDIANASNDQNDTTNDGNEYNVDLIDDLLKDVHESFEHQPNSYESMVDDARIPLYSTSSFTKLSAVLKLFHLKSKYGWSNVSFTELLTLLQEMLPEGNTLPDTTYKARRILCPMGTEWKKNHACPNDCVLYRNEHEKT